MSRNDYGIIPEDNVLVVNRLQDRPRFGLSGNLQRLALVTGIAQFSMSIWVWQFGIFLEANVNQLWQVGLTFSIGTLATIIGYGVAGTIADYFGRKNAMILAFIPMFIGLVLLRFFPHWPWVPLEYATIQIGWAFIIIMTSAIPADELAKTGGENAARTFNMVLLPAFLVDGLSPVVAGLLLDLGYVAGDLHLLAAIGTIVAMIATRLGVTESLGIDIIQKAKAGSIIAFRGLGRNFWVFTAGMLGFVFVMNFSFPYLGNLVVNEWGLSQSIYAFAWSAWSITCVLLMYNVGSLTDRNIRAALIVGTYSTALIVGLFSFGVSVPDLLILNILLAAPIVIWSGAEKTLAVNGVTNELKGRALGTYQFMMSSTRLFGQFIGAVLWEFFGNLRAVFGITSVVGMVVVLGLTYALMSVKLEYKGELLTLVETE